MITKTLNQNLFKNRDKVQLSYYANSEHVSFTGFMSSFALVVFSPGNFVAKKITE